jgi:hypothetical protein
MECNYCGQKTSNPKFCSRSCSVAFFNRQTPRRKKQPKHCKHCGVQVLGSRTTCDPCNPSFVDWSNVTLNAMRQRTTFQYSARIRQVARQVYRQSDKPKQCLVCGYDKHYEVCHKQAISDFADDASIAEINHLDNLIALCPNHHWELDHNHLTL